MRYSPNPRQLQKFLWLELRADPRQDPSLTCSRNRLDIAPSGTAAALVVAHCEFTGRAHGNSVHRARWLLAPVFAVSIAFLAIGMVVS
ncbi:MAG: hypothetical protein EOS09_32475 [Mesorhizobium sp.]|nr:MAG: hypothetical protein EOS09_32475 [Mesorhizobium sp.]